MTQHVPAKQSHVDGGWVRKDVEPHEVSWRREIPPPVVRELIAAAAEFGEHKAGGTQPALPLQVLPASRALATHVRRELRTGFGFIVLTGFPLDEDPSLVEQAYLISAAFWADRCHRTGGGTSSDEWRTFVYRAAAGRSGAIRVRTRCRSMSIAPT